MAAPAESDRACGLEGAAAEPVVFRGRPLWRELTRLAKGDGLCELQGRTAAATPEVAIPLYEQFIARLESELGLAVETGEFGASMQVALINDGPVTITIDSKKRE